jgi:hypothetical protein
MEEDGRRMNEEAPSTASREQERLLEGVESIKRHLRRLIVTVSLMMLFLILTVAAVLGNLVNYFGRDALTTIAQLSLVGLAGSFAIVTGLFAIRENRNCWAWGFLGAVTLPIALIALACVGPRCPKCRRPLAREDWRDRHCPGCGTVSWIEKDLGETSRSVNARISRLVAVVSCMVVALIITVSAVFGELVEYFRGDMMLFGGVTAGAALLGFVLGWFARRKV